MRAVHCAARSSLHAHSGTVHRSVVPRCATRHDIRSERATRQKEVKTHRRVSPWRPASGTCDGCGGAVCSASKRAPRRRHDPERTDRLYRGKASVAAAAAQQRCVNPEASKPALAAAPFKPRVGWDAVALGRGAWASASYTLHGRLGEGGYAEAQQAPVPFHGKQRHSRLVSQPPELPPEFEADPLLARLGRTLASSAATLDAGKYALQCWRGVAGTSDRTLGRQQAESAEPATDACGPVDGARSLCEEERVVTYADCRADAAPEQEEVPRAPKQTPPPAAVSDALRQTLSAVSAGMSGALAGVADRLEGLSSRLAVLEAKKVALEKRVQGKTQDASKATESGTHQTRAQSAGTGIAADSSRSRESKAGTEPGNTAEPKEALGSHPSTPSDAVFPLSQTATAMDEAAVRCPQRQLVTHLPDGFLDSAACAHEVSEQEGGASTTKDMPVGKLSGVYSTHLQQLLRAGTTDYVAGALASRWSAASVPPPTPLEPKPSTKPRQGSEELEEQFAAARASLHRAEARHTKEWLAFSQSDPQGQTQELREETDLESKDGSDSTEPAPAVEGGVTEEQEAQAGAWAEPALEGKHSDSAGSVLNFWG